MYTNMADRKLAHVNATPIAEGLYIVAGSSIIQKLFDACESFSHEHLQQESFPIYGTEVPYSAKFSRCTIFVDRAIKNFRGNNSRAFRANLFVLYIKEKKYRGAKFFGPRSICEKPENYMPRKFGAIR